MDVNWVNVLQILCQTSRLNLQQPTDSQSTNQLHNNFRKDWLMSCQITLSPVQRPLIFHKKSKNMTLHKKNKIETKTIYAVKQLHNIHYCTIILTLT